MSVDAVYELLKTADRDAELRSRLEQDLARSDRPLNAFITTAAEAGFSFTGEEFIQAMDRLGPESSGGQLSETELDHVVAGVSLGTTANNLFRRYRAGPKSGQILPGGSLVTEEEEEILE